MFFEVECQGATHGWCRKMDQKLGEALGWIAG